MMIDTVMEMMEAEGFHYEGFSGRVGEEVLTFKNEAGEVRTIKHGFTSVTKLRNLRYSIDEQSERDKEAEKFKFGVVEYPGKITEVPIDQVKEDRMKWFIGALRFPVVENPPRPIYIITDDPKEELPPTWWKRIKNLINRNKRK